MLYTMMAVDKQIPSSRSDDCYVAHMVEQKVYQETRER